MQASLEIGTQKIGPICIPVGAWILYWSVKGWGNLSRGIKFDRQVKICYAIRPQKKRKEGFFMPKASLKTIAQNKKAFHDYFVEESMEAGIEL